MLFSAVNIKRNMFTISKFLSSKKLTMTFIKEFNHRNFDGVSEPQSSENISIFGKLSVRQNVFSAKSPFVKMSVRQNVRSTKCPSAKCPFCKMSFGKMSGYRLFTPGERKALAKSKVHQ